MIQEIATTLVSELALREPVRTKPDTQLFQVVSQLREVRRGAAIIEDDNGKLLGIFTERDLMRRVNHQNFDWHTQPVSSVMSPDPQSVTGDTTLAGALECMGVGGFRHLPILDDNNHATGVLSIRNILAHIVEHFPAEFLNLPSDPEHEMSGRWGG